MYLKTVFGLSAGSVLLEPIIGTAAVELVNHETLWLKYFLSKKSRQAYLAAFREFCQLGRIASPEALRQVIPAEIISYRDHLIKRIGMPPTQ
ncbi:MAG: hypothetical protein U9Q75_11535 [Pseudomonadota bacterium]|nr:hypothetical protein [Pseudomonadota bacterium]